MPDDLPPFPPLAELHERHYGLTEAVARTYAEGAAVCMQRHHTSPRFINVGSDRIREKVDQLRRPGLGHPGIAGVVAFDLARVGFRRA